MWHWIYGNISLVELHGQMGIWDKFWSINEEQGLSQNNQVFIKQVSIIKCPIYLTKQSVIFQTEKNLRKILTLYRATKQLRVIGQMKMVLISKILKCYGSRGNWWTRQFGFRWKTPVNGMQ